MIRLRPKPAGGVVPLAAADSINAISRRNGSVVR